MSKPRIADLEQYSPLAWTSKEASALLRLARAAKEYRRLLSASSADQIDAALDAFDWSEP